jgi:large subunit ribosomal protein L6
MSRVGKNPIPIPQGVDVQLQGNAVSVSGKLGKFDYLVPEGITVAREDNVIHLTPAAKTPQMRCLWGGARNHLNNMVQGVSKGFNVNMEIQGVGYRASVQGKELVMQLGYSHDIRFAIPDGIAIKCDKPTSISVTGASKQQVGQVAAEIRAYRPPEPYKGKGIRYEGERVLLKEGKKK